VRYNLKIGHHLFFKEKYLALPGGDHLGFILLFAYSDIPLMSKFFILCWCKTYTNNFATRWFLQTFVF